jgi:ATP-dependent DNA helicase RecG
VTDIPARLAKLGLRSDWDFLLHLPLRYEDETHVTPIAALTPGVDAVVEGTVVHSEVTFRGRRQFAARLRDDDSGELLLRFVHFYPSQQKQLAPGAHVRAFGSVRGGLAGLEMIHPRVRSSGAASLPTHLTPVYPTTAGLSQAWLRNRIERALRDVEIRDLLPDAVRRRLELAPLAEALRGVHRPPADADIAALTAHTHPWWTRLKFDELLAQQLSLRAARAARNAQRAVALRAGPGATGTAMASSGRGAAAAVNAAARAATTSRAAGAKTGGAAATEAAATDAAATDAAATDAAAMDAAATDVAATDAAAATPEATMLTTRLLRALPFTLTNAQQRVWCEIEADLAQTVPMHRLVQGDVGSGKTVVAALAAARAIEAGYQAALMAPTELLAEQHFGRIVQWLQPLGVQIAWLAGKLKPSEKRAAQAAVAAGDVQLIVGTHALIQEAVQFARLGLAIVDEQHRFGVAQRLALRETRHGAGDAVPHLLMLSATPIPRTLAMSYFADLDVSVIDQLPPGRQPVVTKLVSTARRDEVLARVRSEVQRGRQAYWVCPLVDDPSVAETAPEAKPGAKPEAKPKQVKRTQPPTPDDVPLTAATTMYEETRALLPELRLGLLHGQLPPAEKTAVMQAFVAGQIDVLVATTVIEVGVDVPNASLMVIEHAQRFGLAQLHQLRGRVGRGAEQSYCVLLFDEPLTDAGRARLKTIFETTDGFEVARRDLQLRGPGEFLGQRQSGVPLLRLADLEHDAALVEPARAAAAQLLREHPEAAVEHVQRWLGAQAEYLAA